MAEQLAAVCIPNIGTDDPVEVIEILVAKNDSIKKGQSLLVLENDKASMEIPAPMEGRIVDIKVKSGDKVSEGSEVMTIEPSGSLTDKPSEESTPKPVEQPSAEPQQPISGEPARETQSEEQTTKARQEVEIKVPDLGTDEAVEIIEVHITKGQQIAKDDILIVLESDKASMEIPTTQAGKVVEVKVKKGDKITSGTPIILLMVDATIDPAPPIVEPESPPTPAKATQSDSPPRDDRPQQTEPAMQPDNSTVSTSPAGGDFYAGPAVRKMARQLGVQLSRVAGSGQKGRILKEDVQQYVKARLQQPIGGEVVETIDFAAYGKIETKERNKIQRLTAENMHRAWITAPHVTQFEEVDITDLEKFRKGQKALVEKKGIKLTPVPFLVKALALALKELPQFNVSVTGNHLVQKFYYHIGMAVDTPQGLVVPVIRDVDRKSIWELAEEASDLADRARRRQLSIADMQGGCITLSSLGALGGTQFTPIINVPEVAILGVSKSAYKPIYQEGKEGKWVPRLMLPIALSYDHRAINGVDGAKFTSYLSYLLGDIRNLTL